MNCNVVILIKEDQEVVLDRHTVQTKVHVNLSYVPQIAFALLTHLIMNYSPFYYWTVYHSESLMNPKVIGTTWSSFICLRAVQAIAAGFITLLFSAALEVVLAQFLFPSLCEFWTFSYCWVQLHQFQLNELASLANGNTLCDVWGDKIFTVVAYMV